MPQPRRLSRRDFLARAAAAGATWGLGGVLGIGATACAPAACPTRRSGDPAEGLDDARFDTLHAAVDRLLPGTSEVPGGAGVNAAGYIDAWQSDSGSPLGAAADLRAGLDALDTRARAAGHPGFASAPAEVRDAILRTWQSEDPTAEAWLEVVVERTLEAWLGDPVHGGNPGGRVWAWLDHDPGYPRPAGPPRILRRAVAL